MKLLHRHPIRTKLIVKGEPKKQRKDGDIREKVKYERMHQNVYAERRRAIKSIVLNEDDWTKVKKFSVARVQYSATGSETTE